MQHPVISRAHQAAPQAPACPCLTTETLCLYQHPPAPPQLLEGPFCSPPLGMWPFRVACRGEALQCWALRTWLPPGLPVASQRQGCFFFKTKVRSVVCMRCDFFPRSPVSGHLGLSVSRPSAAMRRLSGSRFQFLWTNTRKWDCWVTCLFLIFRGTSNPNSGCIDFHSHHSARGPLHSTSSPALASCLFEDRHPDRDVTFPCGPDSHFPEG